MTIKTLLKAFSYLQTSINTFIEKQSVKVEGIRSQLQDEERDLALAVDLKDKVDSFLK